MPQSRAATQGQQAFRVMDISRAAKPMILRLNEDDPLSMYDGSESTGIVPEWMRSVS
jgi:hypothetical protein